MTSTPDCLAKAGVPPYLQPVLSRCQRRKYSILIAIWLVFAGFFWIWWLQPSKVIGVSRYILMTAALFWLFFLQAYFLYFFFNARRAVSQISELGNFRVAMVVTKSPSEPFSIVRETLQAMLHQTVPHDTWLADEDPSPETICWCKEHGVQISTRRGRQDYHRKEWPRRTRCKEGNLAFFYDHYGYDRYDFVSQLDADHVPEPTYLEEMLRPFADPHVGYVSAPSICSTNAGQSWSARSRLHTEAIFHGIFQAGYSGGWAPLCIGSHYAVRTVALREVGGLGPELAEDHSTSMILNAGGWRGVHALDAIAHGAGPAQVSDFVTQEFQWSRSLVTLLLRYTPRYLGKLPARLKFQFLFSQLWYPIFALFMAFTFVMPIFALLFDVRYADVTYPAFVGHAAPATIALIVIAIQIRQDGYFRPQDARILSWEKVLFTIAQWIWVFWGCMMAVWDRLTGGFVDFRVTPKGDAKSVKLPVRVLSPYAVLAMVALAPILLVEDVDEARGFYLLALVNAILYVAVFIVILVHHLKENSTRIWHSGAMGTLYSAAAVALVLLAGAAVWTRGPTSVAALSVGLEPFQVVETKYMVSGAGMGKAGEMKYVFNPRWK